MSKSQKLGFIQRFTQGLVGCCVALLLVVNLSAQDLVVQWGFDEAAGGTVDAVDGGVGSATNGVLGTLAARTTDTPGGGPGFALDLSAAGDTTSSTNDGPLVNGGNSLEVDTLAQFTLSTWVKVTSDSDYNEGGSGNVRLLSKQSGGAFDGISWNMNGPQLGAARSQNAFTMGLFIGGDFGFAFDFASDDILDRGGEWLFLAVTYDGNSSTDNTKFWIGDENNAVAQLGTTLTIDAGPVFSTNTSNGGDANANFGIGFTDGAPGVDFAVTGYQDDVRVYDGVLVESALDAVRLENLTAAPSVDLDSDGDVDGADFLAIQRDDPSLIPQWQTEYGTGALSAAVSAVPEPSTLLLSILAFAALGCRRSQS